MAELVVLPRGPLLSDLRSRLAGRDLRVPVGHVATLAILRAAGLSAVEAEGELSETTVLVVAETGPLYETVHILERLVGPGGCPWDQTQTHASLIPYLLEEAYEVSDAIEEGDSDKLREELGDVLLQPLLHAAIAQREGTFNADSVANELNEKLIRRHPHVFGEASAEDSAAVVAQWERIKQDERPRSALGDVPRAMPALARALLVSRRAARQGFEWPDLDGVWAKFEEEIAELRAATDSASREGELGDLLFTVVNLARWMEVDPERALDRMLVRFTRRFHRMEGLAGQPLVELSPERWNVLWNEAKAAEKAESA